MTQNRTVIESSYRQGLWRPQRPGGVALALHLWGNGRRRALLLHGLASSGPTWWRIADALSAWGFSVWAPDLRGHGLSPKPASYRAADYAADLPETAERWDLVVGHSFGGLVAAHATADERFAARLLLVDPVLLLAGREFEELAGAHVREAHERPGADALMRAHPGWHPRDAELKAAAVRRTSPGVVRRTFADNAPWNHLAVVSAITVPTLMLGADPAAGGLLSPVLAEAIAARNPRVVPVPVNAGHSVHREQPAIVLQAIRELVGGEAGSGRSATIATPRGSRRTSARVRKVSPMAG